MNNKIKIGEKVLLYGFHDGFSYETDGTTNYIIQLETGERVEIPVGGVMKENRIITRRDVISRMKQLFPLSRSEWIDEILHEFGEEFGSMKYREGYEQGKVEGMIEQEKVTIPQVIAEYIEQKKDDDYHLLGAMIEIRSHKNKEIDEWFEFKEDDNMETFARAWIDGYEVEKEPKYTVKFKATNQYLCDDDGIGLHISPSFRSNFRKSDLEKLSLTEVFDSQLFEVEEV